MDDYQLIPVDQAEEWDRAVQRCAPYDTYHLAGYHQVAKRQGEGEPYLFYFELAGRRAALPMLVRPVADVEGLEDCPYRDAVSAYGYPGVITSASPATLVGARFGERFQAALRDALKQLNIVSFFGRQNPWIESSWLLKPSTAPITVGRTVVISLALSEKQQVAQIRNNHRRDIRRARAEGMTVLEDPRFECIDAFRRMYAQTMDRVQAAEHYYFAESYFQDLKQYLGDRVRLLLVRHGDDLVAGAIFLVTGGTIQYHLGGTADEFAGGLSGIKLIFDEVRTWGTRQGLVRFHLGGGLGARDDSLFHFKAGFSNLHLPFETIRMVVQPVVYQQLIRQKNGWAASCGLQDTDIRFFPAYRQPYRRRAA